MTDGQTETAKQQQADANKPNGRWLQACSNEEYHARPEWSNSQLKCLQQDGPLAFRRRYVTGEAPRVSKRAFDLGTVVHAALLEPLGLLGVAAEIPPKVLSSSGARSGQAWKDWAAKRPGKILMKKGELAAAAVMVDRVLGNNEALTALRWMPGESEKSAVWHDPESGLDLRCRFDRITHRAGHDAVLVDVKTTRDVSLRGFAKQSAKLGYHNQAAHYWDGAVAVGELPQQWLLVAVQNSEPFDCVVYELSREDIELGREQNRETRNDLARRLDANDWEPDTYGRIVPLRLPDWARRTSPVEITVGGEVVRM